MRLQGKTVFLTGGAHGLGRALAFAFVAEGARVALIARTADALEDTATALRKVGGVAMPLLADVSVAAEVDQAVTTVEAHWGTVDVLVNNAGVQGPVGPVAETDRDAWLQTVMVNLYGPFLMCRRVLPGMIERGHGKIINLSGGGASSPRPFFAAYASTKAGIVRFTETLSEEVRKYNIQVNAIAPGALPTRMCEEVVRAGEAAGGKELSIARDLLEKRNSWDFDKPAKLAVFLASKESDGLNGRLISAVWDEWESWKDKLEQLPPEAGTLRRVPLGKPRTTNYTPNSRLGEYRSWPGANDPDASERISAVLRAVKGRRVARLLDVGCGDGRITARIAAAVGATEVHGIDSADESVASAKAQGVNSLRIDLDVEPLPYETGYFDMVFGGEVFEHFRDPGRFLMESRRVLAPGGHLVLTTPNLGSWYNRLALLLGFQPWLTAAALHTPAAGKLNASSSISKISAIGGDHLRVVTLKAMKDLSKACGFSGVKFHAVSPTTFADARLALPLRVAVGTLQKTLGACPSLSSTLLVDMTAGAEPRGDGGVR